MPTWTQITMPSTPAPKAAEFRFITSVALNVSPFNFQQQTQDWGGNYMVCNVTMPPMSQSDAAAWVNFLIALRGQANVFAIANSTFAAMVPTSASTSGLWRLTSNVAKWSINEAVIYGIQFEMREAK